MPSGNFADVSRRRKTTTPPKKAKALGGRGRNAACPGCACALQAATQNLRQRCRPGDPSPCGKQRRQTLLLPLRSVRTPSKKGCLLLPLKLLKGSQSNYSSLLQKTFSVLLETGNLKHTGQTKDMASSPSSGRTQESLTLWYSRSASSKAHTGGNCKVILYCRVAMGSLAPQFQRLLLSIKQHALYPPCHFVRLLTVCIKGASLSVQTTGKDRNLSATHRNLAG